MVDKLVNPVIRYASTPLIIRQNAIAGTIVRESEVREPFGIKDRVSISSAARLMYQLSQSRKEDIRTEHDRLLSYSSYDGRGGSRKPALTYSPFPHKAKEEK